jgi:cell division GTPase FtsZ
MCWATTSAKTRAFAHANDVLKNAVGGISDIIHMPGLVNVDFEDVKTVMSEPGKAMMGTAVARSQPRTTLLISSSRFGIQRQRFALD